MVYGEYVEVPQVELASQLAAYLPPSLSTTYFTNSGAEAIEGTIKTARKHTRAGEARRFRRLVSRRYDGRSLPRRQPDLSRPLRAAAAARGTLPFGEEAALGSDRPRNGGRCDRAGARRGRGARPSERAFLSVAAACFADRGASGVRRGAHRIRARRSPLRFRAVRRRARRAGARQGSRRGHAARRVRVLARDPHHALDDPPLGHVTTFGGHPVSCAAGLAASGFSSASACGSARGTRRASARGATCASWNGHLVDVRGLGLLIGIELDDADRTRRLAEGLLRARIGAQLDASPRPRDSLGAAAGDHRGGDRPGTGDPPEDSRRGRTMSNALASRLRSAGTRTRVTAPVSFPRYDLAPARRMTGRERRWLNPNHGVFKRIERVIDRFASRHVFPHFSASGIPIAGSFPAVSSSRRRRSNPGRGRGRWPSCACCCLTDIHAGPFLRPEVLGAVLGGADATRARSRGHRRRRGGRIRPRFRSVPRGLRAIVARSARRVVLHGESRVLHARSGARGRAARVDRHPYASQSRRTPGVRRVELRARRPRRCSAR